MSQWHWLTLPRLSPGEFVWVIATGNVCQFFVQRTRWRSLHAMLRTTLVVARPALSGCTVRSKVFGTEVVRRRQLRRRRWSRPAFGVLCGWAGSGSAARARTVPAQYRVRRCSRDDCNQPRFKSGVSGSDLLLRTASSARGFSPTLTQVNMIISQLREVEMRLESNFCRGGKL